MPFIGNQPTAVPLTSADIADNIISTAKIQDNAVTTAKTSYNDSPFRNIIINGDMSIAQRGTSTASITTSNYYTVDRFNMAITTLGTWTQTQDTDVPSGQGFAKSLKLDCTTADASPAAGDVLQIQQKFEGQNLQYLKYGTANAQSLTLSFWIKSNKTGTYIASFYNNDNARSISKSYTIDSADTWEKKTITYAGDTVGALDNDNASSLLLILYMGAGTNFTSGTLNTSWNSYVAANVASGQVNLADSTSNYINITGVQLEAGTTASDFEFLPYDVNLQRCQRYYYLHAQGGTETIGTMWWYDNGVNATTIFLKTTMRTNPSLSYTTGTNYYLVYTGGSAVYFNSFTGLANTSKNTLSLDSGLSGTAHNVGRVATSTGGSIAFTAEL
jgi:hypothetical protein